MNQQLNTDFLKTISRSLNKKKCDSIFGKNFGRILNWNSSTFLLTFSNLYTMSTTPNSQSSKPFRPGEISPPSPRSPQNRNCLVDIKSKPKQINPIPKNSEEVPHKKESSITVLRSDLNNIKNSVTRFFEDAPISFSEGGNLGSPKSWATSKAAEKEHLLDKKVFKLSRKSTFESLDNQNGGHFCRKGQALQDLFEEKKLSHERQTILSGEKKMLLDKIKQLQKKNQQLIKNIWQKTLELDEAGKEIKELRNKVSQFQSTGKQNREALSIKNLAGELKETQHKLLKRQKEVQVLLLQKEKEEKQFERKINRMNQKFNYYLKGLREKHEKQLRELTFQNGALPKEKLSEIISDKAIKQIAKMKTQIKNKDRAMHNLANDLKKIQNQQKRTRELEIQIKQQSKLIDFLNEEVMNKEAKLLSKKYESSEEMEAPSQLQ